MATPNAAHSVLVRAQLPNHPGYLARLTAAIAEAGGNIGVVKTLGRDHDRVVREVSVFAIDDAHAARIAEACRAVPGVEIEAVEDQTFAMHEGGKIEVTSKIPLVDADDLSMAYTPGVARVCLEIAANPADVHRYTVKRNSVAVVTDGTAVLGLGDIGPYAALPVMEGKAMLFKEFAGIDAFPICLKVDNADDLVRAVEQLEPVFGGINLEDIAAPRCFEVEERLKASLNIPVFHDDQHGTAVVVLAALRNSLRVVDKKMEQLTVVMSGVGAAGMAIAKILMASGVPNIVGVDRTGTLYEGRPGMNDAKQWFAQHTNPDRRQGTLRDVLRGADVFVGVSGPGLLTRDDVATMEKGSMVFALANPDPEILPDEAAGIVSVMATGRSDYPNQINNVLCFPGMFRGALDAGATEINEHMKLVAAEAIAACVDEDDLSAEHVVPSVFDKRVAERVARSVAEAAREDGVVRA